MASVGFATGYYLLQVPLQELQQRRDAVIYALRNFNGGAQQSYGPDDWPRGIDAYRRLYKWLEDQGQGDLRSLLIENEIAQTMDALITRAQNGTPEGLRALGVTAQLDIERFRRMVIVAPGAMAREHGPHGHEYLDRSPPLEAYLQALELFAETFQTAGGIRLLRIARPPILFYGLYNVSQIVDDNALFDLIAVRGTLATIFDGLFPSNSARGVQPQVLLDMLLFELDRGIDLLALGSGTKEGGPTEWRAIALWAIVQVIINNLLGQYLASPPSPPIWWKSSGNTHPGMQIGGPIADDVNARPKGWFSGDLQRISDDYKTAACLVPGLDRTFLRYQSVSLTVVPSTLDDKKVKCVSEELRVQLSLEERWENLVRTIAVEAGDQASVFVLLKKVIEQAAFDVLQGKALPMRMEPPLPPQFEQSLAGIMRRMK